MRRFLLRAVWGVAGSAVCAPVSGVLARETVGAVGGEEAVWVYRDLSDAPGVERLWRFVVCTLDRSGDLVWRRPWGLSDVAGDIRVAAVCGGRLHVWYGDGTHRYYERRRSGAGRALPDAVVPLAAAGDDKGGSLYALVYRSTALALTDDAAAVGGKRGGGDAVEKEGDGGVGAGVDAGDAPHDGGDATEGDDDGGDTADDGSDAGGGAEDVADAGGGDGDTAAAAVDAGGSRWPDSRYVLVRLIRGRWRGDRGLPSWFEPGDDVWLTASGGRVAVVWRPGDGSGDLLYSASAGVDADWSAPESLADASSPAVDGAAGGVRASGGSATVEVLAAGVYEGRPLWVVARGGGGSVSALWRTEGRWSFGAPMGWGGEGVAAWERCAFGVSGLGVVGVWVTDEGTVESASWDIAGGPPRADTAAVRVLSANTDAREWDWRRVTLSYVLLVLVLGAVFVRRRRSVMDGVHLPAGLVLAGHGRRLLAFGIDAALFYPCAVYAYMPLLRAYAFDSTALWQAAMSDSTVMSEITWRWVVAAGGYIGYAMVFEAWWGATPGKRLAHVRVVNENGTRCGLGRVVVRNVLRGVEFYPFLDLMPTLVLILLTRNRQRLGDLIGGTLVVQQVPDPSKVV